MDLTRVYIKLGSDCNLKCKYCHTDHFNCKYDKNILPLLKSLNLKRISFGGGEPLLYWNTIKEIVEYIGSSTSYKIVTNGTLFTQEMIDFCNRYKFFIYISIDGPNSTRDNSIPIKWDLISKLNFSGTAVTFYKDNSDYNKTINNINKIKERYLTIFPTKFTSFPNFIHSTEKTGVLSNRDLADLYINQLSNILEESFVIYKKSNKILLFMKRCLNSFYYKKDINGIRCCNDTYVSILLDGTILACPYSYTPVGNIFELDKVNWEEIKNNHIKDSCKTCDIFDICRNYCWANITDDECYIMKKMNHNFKLLMDKYNVTYDELNIKIRGT